MKRLLQAVPVLALVLLLACGEQAKTFLVIAIGYDEAVAIKRSLYTQGDLDKAGALMLTKGMLDGNKALIEMVDTALCFEHFDQTTKASLLANADVVIRVIDNLQAGGVLHIKSDRGKKSFAQKMSWARITMAAIKATVVLIPARADGDTTPLTNKEQKALDAFRETCQQASVSLHQSKDKLEADQRELELP